MRHAEGLQHRLERQLGMLVSVEDVGAHPGEQLAERGVAGELLPLHDRLGQVSDESGLVGVSRPDRARPMTTSRAPCWRSSTSQAAFSTMNMVARLPRASRRSGSSTSCGISRDRYAASCRVSAGRAALIGSSITSGAPASRAVQ